jgi:hypothetical protein
MQELIKFRNLKKRDCATVVEHCRVLPPLPSPLFAPHCVLLGYAVTTVTTGSRNSNEGPHDLSDVTRNNTPAFIGETEGSEVPVEYGQYEYEYESVFIRVQVRARNREFTTSSQ